MPTQLTDEELALLASMFDLARDGHTDELLAAIRDGVPANLTNDSGDTLLILAAYHDRPDTVVRLLEVGADTERVNDRGQTALGAAVFRQNRVSAQALLSAGAGPRTGERSAMDLARFFDLPAMLALMEQERS